MKIEILQENLLKSLATLQKAIPSKPSLPILSSILIQAQHQSIVLSATDLYLGIRTKVLGSIQTEGESVVPGKMLYETINSLHPGKITLTLEGDTLHIITEDGKTSLQCQSSADYPAFPVVEGSPTQLPWSLIENTVKYIDFSVSSDVTRPVLTAVLWEVSDEKVSLVGTDGFRLSIFNQENKTPLSAQKLLLPSKGLQEVFKAGAQQELETVEFTVAEELKQVLFKLGPTEVYLRLVDGEYPPYQKIIPTEFPVQVVFDTQELFHHLKRALIFARESSNIIHFEITEDKLLITATSPSAGSHSSHLAITHEGQEKTGTIAFNARYLQEYLSTVKSPATWFGMSESLKPALFRPQGMTEYSYIVMPFRVNQ